MAEQDRISEASRDKCLSQYRLKLGKDEYLPLMQGGMGVDISTSALALSIARQGGIGHISDAMAPYVSDRKFHTKLQNSKRKEFEEFSGSLDKSKVKWDFERTYTGTLNHVRSTMDSKRGPGGVFVNVMEKLSMGNPNETMRARMKAAMDGGADGVTLSAGLHTGTLKLIEDLPRFRDMKIGIIVSSARALKIFLRSAARVNRLPDFIVIEGPLAGGHLGFGMDWAEHDLKTIFLDVLSFMKSENLDIPLIPAGGVFTGTDAVEFMEMGAGAVQVATRFTISKECGLPANVKQVYVAATEDEVEVNQSSPTGYPMRMLTSSPSLSSNIKPNCEALGYILDKDGNCQYHQAWDNSPLDEQGKKMPIRSKMCICYHFMQFNTYTCGQNVHRLKETTLALPDGGYLMPSAEHIFKDYLNSKNHEISLPTLAENSSVTVEQLDISLDKSKNGKISGKSPRTSSSGQIQISTGQVPPL
ncbi:MAG TPA: nitronate monooxygenase [Oligoflexia bacterium]|nr:nitronate monooxygenase [Oligoflexia bacterium]HMP48117.1 nitronate monooxygenase [Oligoflexia bacterium]